MTIDESRVPQASLRACSEASSPWHTGERLLQASRGVAERMESVGRRVIRDFMPEQHREFYRLLSFIVIGSVDGAGRVWAGAIEGPPGFVHSPDERLLRIDRPLPIGDPAAAGGVVDAAVGLLGIDLSTRRRNRMNGRITNRHAGGFSVAVEQAFGNCPQYIQRRERLPLDPARPGARSLADPEHLLHLDLASRATIAAADTFFVASFVDLDGDPARRAVDVSHRGGRPGFVRVEDDRLTIPDFSGNLHFNTLGNLAANPRAGLLFIDFGSGDLLQVGGRTEIDEDIAHVARFKGAERLWHVDVDSVVRRRAAFQGRFELLDFSPRTLVTGVWDDAML